MPRQLNQYEASAATGKMPNPIIERRLGGFVTRELRWGISRRGWLALLILGVGLISLMMFESYPFLALTDKVQTDTLVMEGWVHNYAVRTTAREFATGAYEHIYTTGGPIGGMGGYSNDYNTAASVGAGRLRATGVPPRVVEMVPSRVLDRNRTYASAIALREYLHSHGVRPMTMNVVTEGPHARRTRLLFQKAFGSETKVGVIAVQNPDYNSDRWWEYSEGVKDVPVELLAYLYARILFWPR